jgi:hypothetical protein
LKTSLLLSLLVLAVALSAAAAAAPSSAPSIDLVAGSVSGHELVGLPIAEVTAALGRPSWREPGAVLYRIGYGERRNFTTMVIFRKRGGAFRATSVVFERPPVAEHRLGADVLSLAPAAFVRAAKTAYGADLDVSTPLRCRQGACAVTLDVVGTPRHVTYGRTRVLGTYLTLWAT